MEDFSVDGLHTMRHWRLILNKKCFAFYSNSLNLQAIGHQPTQAFKVNLLGDVFGFDRFLLFDDGDNVSLHHPVVLLDPLCELLVIDIAEEL